MTKILKSEEQDPKSSDLCQEQSNQGQVRMRPTLAPLHEEPEQELSRSEKQARRTLARVMIALGRSEDPAKIFAKYQEVIVTSLLLLGRADEAKALMQEYGTELSERLMPR